jgi:hypothetical protein
MSDLPQITESVALQLLYHVARAEKWSSKGRADDLGSHCKKTRGEILDASAECLVAASGRRITKQDHAPLRPTRQR